MARLARVVVPGMPHHITQRGNRKMQTFFSKDDYRIYLSLMAEWCRQYNVKIWAYCLMPNHVHLIVVPDSECGLCRAIGEAHRRYTLRVNSREGWQGHLWQGRFASFVMDESHLISAARYIERNPVEASLVSSAADWPWSSAAGHISGRGDAVAEGDWLTERTAGWVCTWQEHLQDHDEAEFVSAMQRHENTGRPIGDKGFLKRLEHQIGRKLLPAKRGRPRKTKK